MPGRKTKPDPEREYATLGAPPEDSLGAIAWAHEALSVSLFHILNEEEISEKERRKEMRETARVLASLVPRNRLFDAEQLVRGDMAALEDEKTGPEQQSAEKLPRGAHRAPPARGRPR